jgi:peptide/nickel transport system permease protein
MRTTLAALLRRPGSAFGLVVVSVIIAAALAAPWVAPHDPNAIAPADRFLGPTTSHWLGTDNLGRDLLSRIIHGARIALGASLSVIALSLSVGLALGIVAGLAPRIVDQIILGLFDIVTAFPSLILALALVAVLGPGLGNVIILIAIVFAPQFGRVARAQTIAIRNTTWLEAERTIGAGRGRILWHHILPNILGPLFVLASMNIPVVITVESGLSFLGLGVRPPMASWGVLVNEGYTYLDQSIWPAVSSGFALILATLGFSLLGEGLRDAIDPRLQARR